MKIDFYYWGSMCPISNEIIKRLNAYDRVFDIRLCDVAANPSMARNKKMYFPFLTVVNDKKRYYGPISEKLLQSFLSEKLPKETPYIPSLGTTEKTADIRKIVSGNYPLAAQCTGREKCLGCELKSKMYSEMTDGTIGFMNVEGEKLLGGAEYYPSLFVPYDIPKDKDIAFITCVYISDDRFDYKTAPLRTLEHYLARQYKKAVVISDEVGIFPNGDLKFFMRNGYKDDGIVFEDEYCTLHLLSKDLSFEQLRAGVELG